MRNRHPVAGFRRRRSRCHPDSWQRARTAIRRGRDAHTAQHDGRDRPGRVVAAALPQRETEVLQELRAHVVDEHTHVAGSTCLLEGRVR